MQLEIAHTAVAHTPSAAGCRHGLPGTPPAELLGAGPCRPKLKAPHTPTTARHLLHDTLLRCIPTGHPPELREQGFGTVAVDAEHPQHRLPRDTVALEPGTGQFRIGHHLQPAVALTPEAKARTGDLLPPKILEGFARRTCREKRLIRPLLLRPAGRE